jgi:hypothetical protein
MTCQDVELQLDAYLDRTLSAAEVAALDAHLAGCAECQATVKALRGLMAETHALPRELQPTGDLWPGIASRLPPRATPTPVRAAWLLSPTGLAAAALLLILAGGALGAGLANRLRPDPDLAFTADRARYTAAAAELAEQLANDPALLALTARGVITHDLGILDAAIHEAETALAADPGNTALQQMLLSRERQRLDLLERALRAGRQES